METRIVYYDESGDDGNLTTSSPYFVLTSVSMDATDWKENYLLMKDLRKNLRQKYGLHTYVEMHLKDFLYDHNPYRQYNWTALDRRKLLVEYVHGIVELKIQAINVIIDKSQITTENYPILENALKYNIQRIDNTYRLDRNFIAISDEGRVGMMRKTARAICVYNQVPSSCFDQPSRNIPVKSMIEDILEKDSKDSPFIQIADNISYFVNLYYKVIQKGERLPTRVARVIDSQDLIDIMNRFKSSDILNLAASKTNEYGLVIYPK